MLIHTCIYMCVNTVSIDGIFVTWCCCYQLVQLLVLLCPSRYPHTPSPPPLDQSCLVCAVRCAVPTSTPIPPSPQPPQPSQPQPRSCSRPRSPVPPFHHFTSSTSSSSSPSSSFSASSFASSRQLNHPSFPYRYPFTPHLCCNNTTSRAKNRNIAFHKFLHTHTRTHTQTPTPTHTVIHTFQTHFHPDTRFFSRSYPWSYIGPTPVTGLSYSNC
ncbi:hypothetical protein DFP73DRAFT_193441 [Morchella snyderi]|nr:hypothetical protein DFP73DRAFT_193441 [Morchella snyderi]